MVGISSEARCTSKSSGGLGVAAAPRAPSTTKVATARPEAGQTVAGAETAAFFSFIQEGICKGGAEGDKLGGDRRASLVEGEQGICWAVQIWNRLGR